MLDGPGLQRTGGAALLFGVARKGIEGAGPVEVEKCIPDRRTHKGHGSPSRPFHQVRPAGTWTHFRKGGGEVRGPRRCDVCWDSAESPSGITLCIQRCSRSHQKVHSPPQARAFLIVLLKATAPPPGNSATSCGLTWEVLGALWWLFPGHS